MDPLSALIGVGGSVLSSYMNTSSQQAINTANIQQSQAMASGAYLPQLVKNAQAAGLSPLAVLGMHAPSSANLVAPTPGEGVRGAAAALSSNVLHTQRMQDLDEQNLAIQLANNKQLGNNAAIRGAIDSFTLEKLNTDPTVLPSGVTDRSVGNEWFRKLWNNPWGMGWNLEGGFSMPPPQRDPNFSERWIGSGPVQ